MAGDGDGGSVRGGVRRERLPYLSTALTTAAYRTHPVPAIGGCIKERNEDFLVEEVPGFQPAGEGEHVCVYVQKSGLSTTELIGVVAGHFKVKRRDVGFAGMKDKRAVTRQVLTVHTPGKVPEDFPSLRHDRVQVLWADLHTHKLKRGNLEGNGFSIRIRQCDPLRVQDAHRILKFLSARGMANFYGDQRFGARLNNHTLGRHLVREEFEALVDGLLGPDYAFPSFNAEARAAYAVGDLAGASGEFPGGLRTEHQALKALERGVPAVDAVAAVDRLQRNFWISAWQSAMFNRVVARRLEAGTLDELLPGDIAIVHGTGETFRVTEEMAEDEGLRERARRMEVSATGPLWGAEMMLADGEAGRMEADELRAEGVSETDLEEVLRRFGKPSSGARRALRGRVIDPDVEGGMDEHGAFIRVKFQLEPGSFATSVLREVMKVFPMECTHIARRGGHEMECRDPTDPPEAERGWDGHDVGVAGSGAGTGGPA